MRTFFEPLVAGATYDAARRWADDVEQARAPVADAGERAALLEQDWAQALDLGWTLALVPESEGGLGDAYDEYAAILEAGGRSGLALPLAQAIGAVPTLLRVLGGEPARAVLAALAAGEHRATLLADAPTLELAAEPQASGWRLRGRVQGAELAPGCSHYLAPAAGPDAEPLLFWLPADAAGLSARRYERTDGRLSTDLACDVFLPAEALLGRGPALEAALSTARLIARTGLLIEAVGAMASLTEQTASHLKTRVQFNAPLSNFQVLRHEIAEMYAATESSRALVEALLQTLGAGLPADDGGQALADALDHASLHILRHGVRTAYAGIQMHGGMGMTEELPATRLARRLLLAEFEYGGLAQARERLLAAALAA